MTYAPTIDFLLFCGNSESYSNEAFDTLLSANRRQVTSYSALDWLPSIKARFEEIKKECSIQNWDGENALPISPQVISMTDIVVRSFYSKMPRNIPAPDIIPENDGEICLSWDINESKNFSISLGKHGKMNYAGQFGKEGVVHGWHPIDVSDSRVLCEEIEEVSKKIIMLYS
jgi:hypothetical protein